MSGKVTVQLRALVQRINRALGPDRRLKSNRRATSRAEELGTFYVIDLKRHEVVERNVNLIRMAKELKVLEQWEELGA